MKNTYKFLIIIILCIGFYFSNFIHIYGQDKVKSINAGYAGASYSGLTENEFLKNWLVLGPVKVDPAIKKPGDDKQKEVFDKDYITKVQIQTNKAAPRIKIGSNEYEWKPVVSSENVINLNDYIGTFDYAVGYALSEIKMETPAKILMGVGSDDGIKIFLNGKLIHNNWIARGVKQDDDIVELDLKKGSNQLLIKVQNIEMGWSFTIRRLGKDILGNLLVDGSGGGNLDNVKMLLNNGIDINFTNEIGLTAYQNAMIRGREKVMFHLIKNGAKTDLPLPGLDKLVSNIFGNARKGAMPGASVLIARNGEIIYQNGFGYADIGNKVPITPDTKFRIGSISKQFTAAAILRLQEEGKINVEDKLSKYIPDFPRGNEVTIHQLLTHTSGIKSYTNRDNFMKYVFLPIIPKALVDTIKAYPYDFNPGEEYRYNNSGYFILGYLIEELSGMPYGSFLSKTFFKPLGMENTGVYESTKLLTNEAYGYSIENGEVKKSLNWDMDWAGGAGAIYSTVKDLYTWNEAVFNGKVLSESSLKAAFTPVMLNNKQKPAGTEYGYGWAISNNRGLKFIQHSGGLHGFVSYLERQPENKLTVSVLCNSTPPPDGINPTLNGQLISEFVLWNDMEKQSSYAVDTTIDINILKDYTGRYNYGQGAVLIVTLEGKQLFAQMTGQPKFPIYPSSKNEFYWKVVEAKVQFLTDEKGKVDHVIHFQSGQQINAKKLNDETPVKVDPSVFDKYIGKFNLGGNFIIEILKEGDKLLVQGPGMPKYQLFPSSETEFFTNEMNVRIKFQKDPDGKVNSIIANIDGQEKPGSKVKE